jgi:Divergent InlB B-repeat domain
LEVVAGTGSGTYPAGTVVAVSANVPSGGEFVSWEGDTAILANRFLPTTTATVPSANARITFSYRVLTDAVAFTPRRGHAQRMVGGIVEGTNGHPIDGPYETIYTITQPPADGSLSIAEVDLKNFRYLRYRGPENSFANLAEIWFSRDGNRVTGPGFGTPGSWNDQGNTFDKALDGNPETFFDAPIPTGAYVGVEAQ